MKIVKTGDVSRIFSDDLQTFDQIPVGNYKVCFNGMMGFYLEDADSFKLNEQPYGKHPIKIAKVIKLYENIERSAGVILSGKKGMGKSMFARSLSATFAETHGMPTIIITQAFPGIVDFIESIKQECIVLFDEFEKVFDSDDSMMRGEKNERKEPQEKLLGLFDGLSQTKRLYVITVNDIKRVNQYMINRPGRFHYHIQFHYPSIAEIEMYLRDKLKPEFHAEIVLVQKFSNRFDLNYDSLRAIAFELNAGYNFLETMEDLNISTSDNDSSRYNVAVHYSNGLVSTTEIGMNLMSSSTTFHVRDLSGDLTHIVLSPLDIDIQNKDSFVASSQYMNISVQYDEDNEVLTENSEITVEKIVFTKRDIGRPLYGKELEGYIA